MTFDLTESKSISDLECKMYYMRLHTIYYIATNGSTAHILMNFCSFYNHTAACCRYDDKNNNALRQVLPFKGQLTFRHWN